MCGRQDFRLEAEAELPTMFGHFRIKGFSRGDEQCVVLVRGNVAGERNVLTRIQSSCLFGESFHATDCDCNWQVTTSLKLIAKSGRGIFVHLFQEGRGIGIFEKIRALHIEQTEHCDTVEAFKRLGLEKSDFRTYELAVDVLQHEHPASIKLLTNNNNKLDALTSRGIAAVREPLMLEESAFKMLTTHATEDDLQQLIDYLTAKREKMGHDYMTASIRRILQGLRGDD